MSKGMRYHLRAEGGGLSPVLIATFASEETASECADHLQFQANQADKLDVYTILDTQTGVEIDYWTRKAEAPINLVDGGIGDNH
jgi:hypothetical protein